MKIKRKDLYEMYILILLTLPFFLVYILFVKIRYPITKWLNEEIKYK